MHRLYVRSAYFQMLLERHIGGREADTSWGLVAEFARKAV